VSFIIAISIVVFIGAVGAAAVRAGEMTFAEVAIAEFFVLALSAGLFGVTLWLDFKTAEVICTFERTAGQITVERILRGRRIRRKPFPLADSRQAVVTTIADPDGPDAYRLQLQMWAADWVSLGGSLHKGKELSACEAIERFMASAAESQSIR